MGDDDDGMIKIWNNFLVSIFEEWFFKYFLNLGLFQLSCIDDNVSLF